MVFGQVQWGHLLCDVVDVIDLLVIMWGVEVIRIVWIELFMIAILKEIAPIFGQRIQWKMR